MDDGAPWAWASRGLLLLAVIALGVAAILAPVLVPRWMQAPASNCQPSTALGEAPQPTPPGRPPALALRPGQSTTLALGRSLGYKRRQLEFELEEGNNVLTQGALLAVDFDPFLRSDDTELDGANYAGRAEFRDGRLRLEVCLARQGRPATNGSAGPIADAGTYKGTVTIIDPRVARTDVPFTFTLAYPYWPVVLLFVVLTELVAVCWIWVLRRSAASTASSQPVFSGDFWKWLASGVGIASAGVGAAAGVGALIAIYFNGDTWALDVVGVIALLTGVFGAFVTAATVQQVASNAKPST
jgi:hypothetical protein